MANLPRELVHFLELAHLLCVLCDDPLLRVAVWNPMFLAQGVESFLSCEAEIRFQCAVAIVETCVDDFGVPRGGF